ncbi:hypothetical protein [Candidatus Methylomirabilis sp.]|uniref:hypothetical protein n=1 Tax=Candidatus Methylomirabilis sp. TaxID=2032687 RepID=UPI003C74A553
MGAAIRLTGRAKAGYGNDVAEVTCRVCALLQENSMRLKGKRIAILAEGMYQEMELWRF